MHSGKYFFHYPVDVDFYPEGDRRNENQVPLRSLEGKRIISLDPGVRKFMVGYDPDGNILLNGVPVQIETLIQLVTKLQDKQAEIKNIMAFLNMRQK